MLSDEQIKAAVLQVTNDMLDHIYENGTGSEFVIRCMVKAARAIEAAACAERDQRIAELERELEAVRKDAERYRWLAKEHGWWMLKHFPAVRPYVEASEVIDAAIDAAKEST